MSGGGEVCHANVDWLKGPWQEKDSTGKYGDKGERGQGKKDGSKDNRKDSKRRRKGRRIPKAIDIGIDKCDHSQSRSPQKDEFLNDFLRIVWSDSRLDNSFGALVEVDERDEETILAEMDLGKIMTSSGLWWKILTQKKKTDKLMEMNTIRKDKWEDLLITLDSRVSENAISEKLNTQFKVKSANDRCNGVQYVAVKVEMISNRIDIDRKVMTEEEYRNMQKMQVTDVQGQRLSREGRSRCSKLGFQETEDETFEDYSSSVGWGREKFDWDDVRLRISQRKSWGWDCFDSSRQRHAIEDVS